MSNIDKLLYIDGLGEITQNLNVGGNINLANGALTGVTTLSASGNITGHTVTAQNYAVGSTNFISASRQGNFRDLEVKNSSSNPTILLTGDGGNISLDGTLSVDTISEKTSATGVTIDSVLLKDNNITAHTVTAQNYAVGSTNFISASRQGNFRDLEVKNSSSNPTILLTGDGGNISLDGTLSVDTISEKTSNGGVTIHSPVITGADDDVNRIIIKDSNLSNNIYIQVPNITSDINLTLPNQGGTLATESYVNNQGFLTSSSLIAGSNITLTNSNGNITIASSGGGGGGSSVWNTNGNKIYYSGGNVGIGVQDPRTNLDLAAHFPNDHSHSSGATSNIYLNTYNASSSNTSGIEWIPNFSGYSKVSAFLRFVPTGNYFRGELHMGSNNTANQSTDAPTVFKVKPDGIDVLDDLQFKKTTSYPELHTGGPPGDPHGLILYNTFSGGAQQPSGHSSGVWRPKNSIYLFSGADKNTEGWCISTESAAQTSGIGGGGQYLLFKSSTNNVLAAAGYIAVHNTWSALQNFTGQHRCVPNNINYYNNIDDYIGLIVYATGDYKTYNTNTDVLHTDNNAITINDSLPIIELTNKKKDKAIFGIISDKEEENRHYSAGAFCTPISNKNDDKRLYINSVGEGAIWIVNTNGNLENGDYIQSSNVIGMGEKQDDDLLHNYTVAKITCNCNFDINSTKYNCVSFVDSTSGNTYLKAFVGCTYHCG